MALIYQDGRLLLDTLQPVAVYYMQDTGSPESGPGPLSQDFIGAYPNLPTAYEQIFSEGFDPEDRTEEDADYTEPAELNIYGLPYGYIPENITHDQLTEILKDNEQQNP